MKHGMFRYLNHVALSHFVAGCAMVVVAGVILWTTVVCGSSSCVPGVGGHDDNNSRGRGSDVTNLATQSSFAIDGSTTQPISPGVEVPLDLRFENTLEHKMSVTDLEVTVQDVVAQNASELRPCLPGDFTVDQMATGLDITVAPHTTSSLNSLDLPSAQWPQVGLRNTSANQDGCKGAQLKLSFTASGTVQQ
jgi:hypothetical protein